MIELTEEDENKMYRCMICKRTGKPYKFFEDLYLGMNAHFVRHHPAEHSEMMEKHVEALVNGEWLKPKSVVVDEAFSVKGKDKDKDKKHDAKAEKLIPEEQDKSKLRPRDKPEPEEPKEPELVKEESEEEQEKKKFY